MQTIKARAQYHQVHGRPTWRITHPCTSVSVWTDLPRDGAAFLIERYVLVAQIDRSDSSPAVRKSPSLVRKQHHVGEAIEPASNCMAIARID